MSCCPACDAEIDVDEFDVQRDDELSCPECGSNLVVTGVAPVALDSVPDVPEDSADDWPRDDEGSAKPFH